MLAFAKDITQNKPKNSKESENDELKQYMDYQRKLNHERLVHHALDYAKNHLQLNIQKADGNEEQLNNYLQNAFPYLTGLAMRKRSCSYSGSWLMVKIPAITGIE